MSFILDALQRAQKAHDQQAVDTAPILADQVADAPANPQARVLWATAAVLSVISIALIAWTLGRETAAPTQTGHAPQRATATSAAPTVTPQAVTPNARGRTGSVRALDVEASRGRPTPSRSAGTDDVGSVQIGNTDADDRGTDGNIHITNTTPGADDSSTDGMISITPAGTARDAAPGVSVMPARNLSAQAAASARAPADLPEYESVLLSGQVPLPDLRMDMHIFHDTPGRRFVFINFEKMREGERLDSKTVIEEITSDGAILNHDGRRFVLRPN